MQQFDSRAAIPPVIEVRMFSLDKEVMRGQESKSDTFCKYLKERGIRAGLDIKGRSVRTFQSQTSYLASGEGGHELPSPAGSKQSLNR